MKFKSILGYFFVALISVAVLSGCGDDPTPTPTSTDETSPTTTPRTSSEGEPIESSTTEASNKVPVVNAGNDKTVQINETVTITGTASDSDGTIVSHEWKKGNSVLATTLSFSYTPTVVGTDTLTLTVTDNDGATASDSVQIIVEDISEQETEDLPDFGEKK